MDKRAPGFPGALFFLLIAVPLFFWSKLTDCYVLPKIVLTELVVLFLLFIHLIKQRRVGVGFIRPGGLDKSSPYIPIALFLLWSLISIFKAVNIHQSFNLVYQFLIYLIFYFLLLNNLKREEIEKIILAIFLVSFLISLYGILQYFGIDFLSPSRKNSPISSLGNPNFTAEYLVSIIPLMLMYGISKFSCRGLIYQAQAKQSLPLHRQNKYVVAELARLCCTFIILFCLLLTQTRASWLGLFVSLIFILIMLIRSRGAIHRARKTKMAILMIIPLIIFLSIFSPSSVGRKSRKRIVSAFNLRTGSTALRLMVWKDTLRMVKRNPVLGVGIGNYNVYYPLYQSKEVLSKEIRIDHTHNDYLQLAAETGIVGLLLFLWFLFSVLRSCFYLLKKEKEDNSYLIILGITGGLIAVLVNAFFAFPLQNPSVFLNLWLFLGLIGVLSRGRIYPTRGLDKSSPYKNKKLIIAVYIFLSFLVLRPLIADYCLKAGMGFVKERNWRRAEIEFKKAIFWQPSNIFARFHYGNLLLNRRRPKEAIKEFYSALKLHPNYPQTHSNLAIACGEIGLDEEALKEYKKAIALNPKRAEFYNNLGAFYYQRGKYQEAITEFQKAVKLSQHFNPLSSTLKRQKKWLKSEKIRPSPTHPFLFFVPLIICKKLYDYTLIKFALAQILVLFILLTFLVQKKRLQFPFPLTIFICLWFLINIFSFIFSSYRYAGVKELNELFTYLTIFFLVFNLNLEKKHLFFWFASGILLCLWAISDFCKSHIVNAGFGNKNFFAGYIILLIPICLSLIISQFKKTILEKSILIPFLVLALLSLFLTKSQAAYLATIVSILFLFVLYSKNRKVILIKIFSILFFAFLVSLVRVNSATTSRAIPASAGTTTTNSAINRTATTSYGNWLVDKVTGNVRFLIWQGTIKMVRVHPLKGFGIGSLVINYPKYRLKEYFLQPAVAPITDHSHNEYLEMMAETGILGLLLFLLFIFFIFKEGLKKRGGKVGEGERAIIIGLLCGVFAVLIDNLFSTNLRNPSTALFFWFFLGLIARKTDRKISLNQKFSIFFLIFFLICLSVACFQTIKRDFVSNLYLKKAVIERGQENFPAAIIYYKKTIESDPYNLAARYKLAFAYGALKKYNLALSTYKKLYLLAPHYARIDKNIGVLYYGRRKLGVSLHYFRRAEKINPYDIDILSSIASIYLLKGEFHRAKFYLRRVLILDAKNSYALACLKKMKEDGIIK